MSGPKSTGWNQNGSRTELVYESKAKLGSGPKFAYESKPQQVPNLPLFLRNSSIAARLYPNFLPYIRMDNHTVQRAF